MTATEEIEEQTEATVGWSPRLFPRQVEAINNPAKIKLLSGPRFSGKSIALAHNANMRAWDTYNGNIGIVVSSYKVATGGGSWEDIVIAAKEWSAAGITSEFGYQFAITSINPDTGLPGSKLEKSIRTPYMTIRNKFGTESTIRLISIDNENEIEEKTKSGRFHWIWIVELSNFTSRKIITAYFALLRTFESAHADPESPMYLPETAYQLVADTNPAPDGKRNWIYQWFYEFDNGSPMDEKERAVIAAFKKKMAVEELFLEDNIFLASDKRDELVGLYAGDPIDYMRFVEGKWPDGSLEKSSLFGDVFTNALMVDGYIEVDELTTELITGSDLGPKNKGWVLLERRIVEGKSVWCVLDEIVYLNDYISTEDFTRQVMQKLIEINEHYKAKRKNFKGFQFEHWSDNSSWNMSLNDESGTEALEVYNASGGQIEMRPVDKPAKSVEVGCQIIRKLMREERFFIGNNTPHLKKSLMNMKRSSKAGVTIDKGDPLKHVADALRYPIFSREVAEMSSNPIQAKYRNRRTMSVPV